MTTHPDAPAAPSDPFGALRSLLQQPPGHDLLEDLGSWARRTPDDVFWSPPVVSYLNAHLARWPIRLRMNSPGIRASVQAADPLTRRRLLHIAPATTYVDVNDIDAWAPDNRDQTHGLWSNVFGHISSLDDARERLGRFGRPLHLAIDEIVCFETYRGKEEVLRDHLQLVHDPDASHSPRSLHLMQHGDRAPIPWDMLSRFQDVLRPAHVTLHAPISKGEQEEHHIHEMFDALEPSYPLHTLAVLDSTLTDDDVDALAGSSHLLPHLHALSIRAGERADIVGLLCSARVARLDTLILHLDWDPPRWGSLAEDPPALAMGEPSELDTQLIAWAAQAAPGIRRLALKTDSMTLHAMRAIAESPMAKTLEDLRLFGGTVDVDAVEEMFGKCCPNLHTLELNRHIHPKDLLALWGFIPQDLHPTLQLTPDTLDVSIWAPHPSRPHRDVP